MIRKIDGRLNTKQYINFLNEFIWPETQNGQRDIFLVHDKFPVHHARAVQTWLGKHERIGVVPWPPNFGDVMPFESLWNDMLNDVCNMSCKSPDDMWDNLKYCFEQFDQDYLEKLFKNIPSLLQSVFENDGKRI